MLQKQLAWATLICLPLLITARESIVQIEKNAFVEVIEDDQVFLLSFEQISEKSLQGAFTPKLVYNQPTFSEAREEFRDSRILTTNWIPAFPQNDIHWIKEYTAFLINGVDLQIFYVAENDYLDNLIRFYFVNDLKPSTRTRPFYESKLLNRITGPMRLSVNFVLINSPFHLIEPSLKFGIRSEEHRLPFLILYKEFDDYFNPHQCMIAASGIGYDPRRSSNSVILRLLKTSWNNQYVKRFWADEDQQRIYVFMEVYSADVGGVVCVQRSEKQENVSIDDIANVRFEVNPEPIALSQGFTLEEVVFDPIIAWPHYRSGPKPSIIPEDMWKQLCAEDRDITD